MIPASKRSDFSPPGTALRDQEDATDTQFPNQGVGKECGDQSLQVSPDSKPATNSSPSVPEAKEKQRRAEAPLPIPPPQKANSCPLPPATWLSPAAILRAERWMWTRGRERLTLDVRGFSLPGHPQSGPFPLIRSSEPPVPHSPWSSGRLGSGSSLWRRWHVAGGGGQAARSLGSARLGSAARAQPPLRCPLPAPRTRCGGRGGPLCCAAPLLEGAAPGSSERQPSAHLLRLLARPPHVPSSPRAQPSVPWAPLAPERRPRPATVGRVWEQQGHSIRRDWRKLMEQAPIWHSCLPGAPWSPAN